ncbi:MAG TPA: S9 family peptidase [Gemmatimonadaceae bacterium]|nr:S9 family peptidase [Gemmatimonadaceae bacterium]
MPRRLALPLPRATLVLALAFAPAAPIAAQQKPADTLLTIEKYLDYEQVADPQISPDGRKIVYTRRLVNRLEDRWESGLWVMDADGARNRFLVKGSGAIWSPDGTRIAYIAEGEPKGTQIFVRWMDAEGATTQVTHATESPSDLRWSPDGKWIGFSMVVPKASEWRIDLPAPPKGAKWTGAPRIVESRHFRQDRRGFMEPGFRHLFLVPADGGTPRQLTKGDWSIGARFDALDGAVGWDWTPDGRTIIADGLADSTWDANYRASNLYAIDVESGAMRRLTATGGEWSSPVVSPDGKRIAYRGDSALKSSYHASELYVMNLDGSGARKLSGDLDRDVSDLHWAPDGGGIYFTVQDRGTSNVYYAPLAGGARAVTTGDHLLAAFTMSRRGDVGAGVRSSAREPGDIVRIALARRGRGSAEVARLTRVNEDLLARVRLGEVERIRYASTGGTQVDGWIVKPPDFDPSRKYPLLMEIHGGPHAMYTSGFNYAFHNFAANGYVVLYTNPRGSTSYGSAFGNAIMHRYPGVDYEDLMAGVDAVVSRGYVDSTRMYVGGCSGGGVLSSWVIGHTNRFAAAAVRCPVINWMSFAGQTDVPLFTENFFDAPFWEKPEQWLKQSPLMYVGSVTTPTIVMTGELDLRTPMPQSEEYYAALKARGVPTALLRFEGEYHGTGSRPSNFMRTQLYMMSWYQRWRRDGSAAVTTSVESSSR